jgi:hypothetical protein
MEYHVHTGFHYCKLLTFLAYDYGSFINISGKNFLIDLDVGNIFDRKLHGVGAC